jgi:hypothetical protein
MIATKWAKRKQPQDDVRWPTLTASSNIFGPAPWAFQHEWLKVSTDSIAEKLE